MSSAVITNYLYFIPVTMTMFDVTYQGNRFSKATLITVKDSHVLIFLQQFLYCMLIYTLIYIGHSYCFSCQCWLGQNPFLKLSWIYYEASAVSHKVTVFLMKNSLFLFPHTNRSFQRALDGLMRSIEWHLNFNSVFCSEVSGLTQLY